MNKVYGLMSVGMLLTGGVAWAVGTSDLLNFLRTPEGGMTIFGWVVMFAPLAMVFAFGALINRMSGNAETAAPARQQPPVSGYDEDADLSADDERIEIPAFLRRQEDGRARLDLLVTGARCAARQPSRPMPLSTCCRT